MAHKMKEYPLTDEQIGQLLKESLYGRLAVVGEEGYPRVKAVHFLYHEGCIYIYAFHRGQRLRDIRRNTKVCFEVEQMEGVLTTTLGEPSQDAHYQWVEILGDAVLMEDLEMKREILDAFARKYLSADKADLSEDQVRNMSVVEIMIRQTNGKCYK